MPLHRAVGLEPRALPPSAAPPGVEPNDPAWEEREVTPAEQMHPADQDGMVDDYFDDGMGDGDPMEDIEAGGRDDTEDVVFANAGLPNESGPRVHFPVTAAHQAQFGENRQRWGKVYPFDGAIDGYGQLALALSLSYPTPLSNKHIQNIAVNGKGVFLADDCGFRSLAQFQGYLNEISGLHQPWQKLEYNITGASNRPAGFANKHEYWALDSMAILCEILGNPHCAKDFVWAPRKCYDTNGHRVYGEMHTGDWWWEQQTYLGQGPGGGSCTVVPFILSSDKAVFGNLSGQQKGWPLLLSVGNIPSRKRFLLTESNTRMIALLPMMDVSGNVTAKEEHRMFKLRAYHDIIGMIMRPIFAAVENGVNILCGDGQQRLCFPRFAQYIADYEEQRDLAGIMSLRCTKCAIPTSSVTDPARTQEHWLREFEARTMEHSMQLRGHYRLNPKLLRQTYGYLAGIVPFSDAPEPVPGCTMYHALAPDTLHQVTKNFWDRLVKRWVRDAVLVENYPRVSAAKLDAELDLRLKQLSPFSGLRHFSKGISHVERWTGQEYKSLLRVYLGVIRGIASPDVVKLVKAYLEVHRLAMYRSHTDNRDCLSGGNREVDGTLQLLEKAVVKMWEILMDPSKIWIRAGIVRQGWWAPKLHLMQHYADEIRRKGSLPQCSTENTEPFHRPMKQAYNASNRGASALAFITRTDSIRVSLRRYLDDVLADWTTDPPRPSSSAGTPSHSEDEATDEESEEELDQMGLDQDPGTMETLYQQFSRHRYGPRPRYKFDRRSVRLSGPCKPGYPKELLEAEHALGLPKFERRTLQMLAYIRHQIPPQGGRIRLDGLNYVAVYVFEQMHIVYNKQGTDDEFDAHTVHCTDSYNYQQDENKAAPRRDTVLVQRDKAEGDWEDEGTMKNRDVARILCLFSLNVVSDRQFAFIRWFSCSPDPEDDTGMFVVRKTNDYEVVDVRSIERGVHLIPDFGDKIGSTEELPEGKMALDFYKKFVINNHLDLEMYKSVY